MTTPPVERERSQRCCMGGTRSPSQHFNLSSVFTHLSNEALSEKRKPSAC